MQKNKMKQLRLAKGLTQKELADIAGVNIRSLQKYDNEERDLGGAAAYTVVKIARALDTTVEDILLIDKLTERGQL